MSPINPHGRNLCELPPPPTTSVTHPANSPSWLASLAAREGRPSFDLARLEMRLAKLAVIIDGCVREDRVPSDSRRLLLNIRDELAGSMSTSELLDLIDRRLPLWAGVLTK